MTHNAKFDRFIQSDSATLPKVILMLLKVSTTHPNLNVTNALYKSNCLLKIKIMGARNMNRREAKLQAMSLACVLCSASSKLSTKLLLGHL